MSTATGSLMVPASPLVLAGTTTRSSPLATARIIPGMLPNSKLHLYHGGDLGLVTQAHELAPVVTDSCSAD